MADSTIGNLPDTATTFDDADLTVVEQGGTTKKITGANFAAAAAFAARYLAKAFFAAKGDLLTATANDTPALLTVGANTTMLVPDSTQATGLTWLPRPYLTGSTAGRPAATAVPGFIYSDTDTDTVYLSDGTGWIIMSEPPQAFTPTWTNLTVGNATVNAGTFHRSDGWVDWYVALTFGSTTAITGSVDLILPVSLFNITAQFGDVIIEGGSYIGDNSTGLYYNCSIQLYLGAGAIRIYYGGVTPAVANLSASVPFTWTTNDNMLLRGRTRLSTRYS